jgi:cytidine deaminase
MSNWNSEDDKLAVLAKGARSRIQAKVGAALRDETGRTYASAEVSIGALTLTSVQMVVAQAVASGSTGAEAVVISPQGESSISDTDLELVRDFAGTGVPIYLIGESGDPVDSRLT